MKVCRPFPPRFARALALAVSAGFFAVVSPAAVLALEPLRDAPILWWENDAAAIPNIPAERDPIIRRDQFTSTFARPLQRNTRFSNVTRRVGSWFAGDHVPPASNVNALDEIPNSTWFTNRIGLFPMTPQEVAHGPGEGTGPDTSGPWTVVSAKTQGVTPGFNIKDARGDIYLVKFDPPGSPGLVGVPSVLGGRIFHAAGYFVPEDFIVTFPKERLVLGDGVKIRVDGKKRPMTMEDLDRILATVAKVESGEYLAIASKFLKGKPLGPFDYLGQRRDDPNDRIRHEHRRELRGLRVLAAWTHHFDTKQHNSLDMLVEEDGRRFVRHHLIDFGSTLGAGAHGGEPKYGREYGIDAPQIGARLLALGFHEDDWRRVEAKYPPAELAGSVGYYDVEYFNPKGFKPLLPNPAFANLTDRDGYWAAKIITAFTDAHLDAIADGIPAPNPAAVDYLIATLKGRRNIIAREWFTRVPPIDYFRVEGSWGEPEEVPSVSSEPLQGFVTLMEGGVDATLAARDLGVERGIWPAASTHWRVRCAAVDANREPELWTDWEECAVENGGRAAISLATGGPALALSTADPSKRPFLAFEWQTDRGDGWSDSVTAYVARASGHVVAVDR